MLALCWYWASDGIGSKVFTTLLRAAEYLNCVKFQLIKKSIVLITASLIVLLISLYFIFAPQDMVVLPYKDSLLLFSRYLQQLVMESLGKEFDLDGNRVCATKLKLLAFVSVN